MSNRSARRKSNNKNKSAEMPKSLSYGTIIGLIVGLVIGLVLFLITDNMLWIALPPILCFFIGLGVGSYMSKNNKKTVKKHS